MPKADKAWNRADKDAFSSAFNGGGKPSAPHALAGMLAKAFASDTQPEAQAQPAAEPSPGEMNLHMQKMREAADAAKIKYMKDNGVDENGDPVR